MIKRSDNPSTGYYGPGHEISYKKMTAEEERDLFKRYREDGDTEARDTVVRNQLLLVAGIAIKMAPSWMPIDEVISAANNGLMKAAKKFDYKNGARFPSYARKFIRGEIIRLCRDQAPVHIPNGQPMCESVQWDNQEILPDDAVMDEPCDDPSEEVAAVDRIEFIKKSIRLALNDRSLDCIERHVLIQHFFHDRTFKQIAEELPEHVGRSGLSRARIGQIKDAGCAKLKSILARHGIKGVI